MKAFFSINTLSFYAKLISVKLLHPSKANVFIIWRLNGKLTYYKLLH